MLGQIAFATLRSPLIRAVIALLYAVPAAVAGYQLTLGLASIGMPAEGWQQAFAVVGAISSAATALARMALVCPARRRTGHRRRLTSPSSAGVASQDRAEPSPFVVIEGWRDGRGALIVDA